MNRKTNAGGFLTRFKIKQISSEITLLMILVVICLILTFANDAFLTGRNFSNLGKQTSINGIVAIGMTFVIISGGIDLSVGPMVGMSSMVAALLMRDGTSMLLAVVIGVVSTAVLGAINGVTVYKGKVPPFIATLGMMTVVRAVIMLLPAGLGVG